MYGEQGFYQAQYRYATPQSDRAYPIPPSFGNAPPPQNFISPRDPRCASILNKEAIPLVTLETRQGDEAFFENFLRAAEQSGDVARQGKRDGTSKIFKARSALTSVCRLNKQLEAIGKELTDALTDTEWEEKLQLCESIKEELAELFQKLKDPAFIERVKKDLEKRKRKRLREKRKRADRKAEKVQAVERRARLHAEADAWIREKQAVVEREKQEENLRKEADVVLSDVRGKRSDARKFLTILQELQNLRRVKANIVRARGEHLSSAADEAFNNIIVKLVEQWMVLDREYSIEEQGLKLMLKEDSEQKIEKQKRNIFNDWEVALFGRKLPKTEHVLGDLHTFVMNRAAWDKYIDRSGEGTPIPIGWVVPDKPSSAAWQKCLRKD